MQYNVIGYSNEILGQVEAGNAVEAWAEAGERFEKILDVRLIDVGKQTEDLDYTYEDLYQLYLMRNFDKIESWVYSHTGNYLRVWAKKFNISWYGGSKASFLRELMGHLSQSKAIRGEVFHIKSQTEVFRQAPESIRPPNWQPRKPYLEELTYEMTPEQKVYLVNEAKLLHKRQPEMPINQFITYIKRYAEFDLWLELSDKNVNRIALEAIEKVGDNVEVYISEVIPEDIARNSGLYRDPAVEFRYTTYYYGPDLHYFERDLQRSLREQTGNPNLAITAYYLKE